MSRQTIAVDFDGVIHSYTSKWTTASEIPDPPVEGAIEWLHEMVQKFEVIIFSTRAETFAGQYAIKAWLKKHADGIWWPGPGYLGIEEVRITYKKEPAIVYIDDRGWRFEGKFPSAETILGLKPWNK